MKIRRGFVSNSSSSSFTCDVCDAQVSGWDMCNEDAEMYDCVNGHSVCDSHIEDAFRKLAAKGVNACIAAFPADRKEELRELFDEQGADEQNENCMYDVFMEVLDNLEESRYELPTELCPLCTLQNVTRNDVFRYILYNCQIDYKEVCEEIKDRYGGNPSLFYDRVKNVSLQQ